MLPFFHEVAEFELPDEIFETATRRYTNTRHHAIFSSNARMIYTQKTRVVAADSKRKTNTMTYSIVQKQRKKGQATEKWNFGS